MSKTKITWATDVWNPVTGCTKISEGCRNCYAERMAKRLGGRYGYPKHSPFQVTLQHERLSMPDTWKKPRRIFVNSMSDLFHDEVPYDFIDDVMMRAYAAARHTYLFLTKRPERMLAFHQAFRERPYWTMESLWIGVTAEDQQQADLRIPLLLEVPASVQFISVEPMLEEVDIRHLLGPGRSRVDWVICGPENGPGARPFEPDWARSLRDQCRPAAGPLSVQRQATAR